MPTLINGKEVFELSKMNDLAKKLQQNDLKNEGTLREVIQTLSQMTGKSYKDVEKDLQINY